MTVTSDLDALLAAVLASPEDDTPRLVYADALEERAGPGDVKRAEFIRVQCELATIQNPWCEKTESPVHDRGYAKFAPHCRCSWCRLKRREYMLSRRYICWDDWDGAAKRYATFVGSNNWSRGFIAEVHCTLAVWCGGPCERCHGLGYITRPVGNFRYQCSTCIGSGRLPGHGHALVRQHPITRVTLTEEEPICTLGDHWQWLLNIREAIGCDHIGGPLNRSFYTRDAALDALSTAALTWAKGGGKSGE